MKQQLVQFYSEYMDAISEFIGMKVVIQYNEKSKDISLRFRNLGEDIIKINKFKFKQISHIVIEVLIDFYNRYKEMPYRPIYKQLLVEELAYKFIDENGYVRSQAKLMDFVEKLKGLCNKTYELESVKMGFIVVKDTYTNVKALLNQYNINYYNFVEIQELDSFINEKQTLKLANSNSICFVLNSEYKVIGMAKKRKGLPSIKNILLDRYEVQEKSDISHFAYDYYVKSLLDLLEHNEIEEAEDEIFDLLLKIKSEYIVAYQEYSDGKSYSEWINSLFLRDYGLSKIIARIQYVNKRKSKNSSTIGDLLDKIKYEHLNAERILRLQTYLEEYGLLQDKVNYALSFIDEEKSMVNGFLGNIEQKRKNETTKVFDFVYLEKEKIIWSSSHENKITYSNGRWKLTNYFLLRNIVSKYIMQQHEIQKQSLNVTLEIISNLTLKIFELYNSIKSLADKNIGSLICILNKNYSSTSQAYSELLSKGKLTFNQYEFILKDENGNQINIKDCDNSIFELVCSLDGAVILDHDLNIQSAGEMINNGNVRNENNYRGARSLATLAASRFGLAIKISEDGEILIFENDEREIARL